MYMTLFRVIDHLWLRPAPVTPFVKRYCRVQSWVHLLKVDDKLIGVGFLRNKNGYMTPKKI
jgi:hypothetical protein